LSATSTLHNSLWRQGAILPRELLTPGVILSDLDPHAKLILLSHDCDIVQSSYDLEPYVEFFVARPASKLDGTKTKGKNPRCLQLHLVVNGEEKLYEISVHEKYRDKRTILEQGTPEASCRLSQRDIQTMGRWAGKRYHRPALPTAFNNRLSDSAKRKFRKAIEQCGAEVSGIFIFFESERELPDNEPYRIIVRIVAPRAIVQDDREEQTLLRLVAKLQEAFAICPGIEIEELKLDSEAEFSLEDFKSSKVWDYEYLSISEEDDHTYLAGSGL
jgi:hypothetical protein